MSIIKHPLFEGVRLGKHHLPNRAVVAPMSRISATPDGLATAEMAQYYTAFAAGGFGMIITEGCYTDPTSSQAYEQQPGLVTTAQATAWQKVAASVKQYPTVLIAQLMHAGALSQLAWQTYAPSSVQPVGHKMTQYGGEGDFPMPKELSSAEIAQVKQGFIAAAVNASRAGFDGVELHAANGYLLDQFLTAELNHRTDAYGGGMPNRFRLISEIMAGIRAQVPADFLLGLRLSEGKVNDLAYRWPQGALVATELLTEVQAAAPDFVHIAVQSSEWEQDSFYPNGTSLAALARQLTGVPVIANGGMHELNRAARALRENHADLLAIGKAALADPSWPLKVQSQQLPLAFDRAML